VAAPSSLSEPAEDRNQLDDAEPGSALQAVRGRRDQVKAFGLSTALLMIPLALKHYGQSIDDQVHETSDDQAQESGEQECGF
jgi:hypothetical protein